YGLDTCRRGGEPSAPSGGAGDRSVGVDFRVDFRVLGPVEVVGAVDGRPVDIGHPRQRAVLAVLAVDAGRVVPVQQLVERWWGSAPPASARNVLSGHISRLRGVLPDLVQRRAAGYLLAADPDAVDLHRFRRLVAEARAAARPGAVELLDRALALWR